MTTSLDIQTQLETMLLNDADLTVWLLANFNTTLTVLMGNRKHKVIAGKKFPLVSIVFEPKEIQDKYTSEPSHLIESYSLDLGLHFAKASEVDRTHLQLIAEFEHLAATAVLQDRLMGGSVIIVKVSDRIGDANVNHPYHFFTLVLEVQRTGSY